MNRRASTLIATLGLAPHPEGGYFREIHRSPNRVAPSDLRPSRAALTVIYFLLTAGDVSRWHRVASDETWHFHEGAVLDLLVATPDFLSLASSQVGAVGPGCAPVRVVPSGAWQTARTTGAYSLVSCSVGPGFDFADFEMLRDRPDDVEVVRRTQPVVAAWI